MGFHSILFEKTTDGTKRETASVPEFFADLNLDQIVDRITAGRQVYRLKPFFYTPLRDIQTIAYRQETMRDLQDETLLAHIKAFSEKMVNMRRYLAMIERLYYKLHQQGWFLEAVEVYCDAVRSLSHDLSRSGIRSRGLMAFRTYMAEYVQSDAFTALAADTQKVKNDLSTVKYCVRIKGDHVNVRRYAGEINYSVEVEATFRKFKQGAVKDYKIELPVQSGMNHVEAQILDLVAKLYPEVFSHLDDFCAQHRGFPDETIRVFDREIQFYVAYLEHIAKFKCAGLPFCYPRVTHRSKEVYDDQGFDLALADKLLADKSPIVCNDFYLKGKERIFVVSGPNQGGKTTFARTFGQLHYLASLGCPVPGRRAQLFLCDGIFTHFEKVEDITNLRGKLQDDLVRIHAIIEQATPDSIILINEIFSSTALQDARVLSKKILECIIQLDLLCVYVTFIDELASLGAQTVSMVSTVVPGNPALRTYKIERKPADGLAFAISIAEKYRLTYDDLKERIPS